jgi:membrane-associated phospholipid phosphatase
MRMRGRVHRGDRSRETLLESMRQGLWSTEYLTLFMLLLFMVLDLVFIRQVKSSFGILQINITTIVSVIAIAMWHDQTGTRLAHIIRSFYILPVGYMLYAQVHNYIPLVNPHNYDHLLASWDRAIFGVNPTEWIGRFSHPVLTEYLQIWYNVFQLMLVIPAVEYYRRRRMVEFRSYANILVFGFYLSYLLYFVMPAIGPRFEVHDFYAIDRELPGVFLTGYLRDFINAGNNITPQMTDPYLVVNRDCMPSGHTMMSVLGILMAWRYRSRWRWLITIGGISIIVSTIYLRYHYVVDLMAGVALAFLVYASLSLIARFWRWRRIEL